MKSNSGVIVGLVMAGALFIGCESEPEAKSKEERIAAIKEIGGEVTLTPKFTVDLSGTKITDGLVHLKGLTGVEALNLSSTQVTDAGLEHLKELTGLKVLYLHNTQITDAGLVHLKGLTGLRRLNLSDTRITDAGLAKLKAALPKCDALR